MLQVGQCNISFSFIKPLLKIHPFWHFIKTKIKFLNLSNATDNINIQKTNLQQFVSINAKSSRNTSPHLAKTKRETCSGKRPALFNLFQPL